MIVPHPASHPSELRDGHAEGIRAGDAVAGHAGEPGGIRDRFELLQDLGDPIDLRRPVRSPASTAHRASPTVRPRSAGRQGALPGVLGGEPSSRTGGPWSEETRRQERRVGRRRGGDEGAVRPRARPIERVHPGPGRARRPSVARCPSLEGAVRPPDPEARRPAGGPAGPRRAACPWPIGRSHNLGRTARPIDPSQFQAIAPWTRGSLTGLAPKAARSA
jgi:hypothetical protein